MRERLGIKEKDNKGTKGRQCIQRRRKKSRADEGSNFLVWGRLFKGEKEGGEVPTIAGGRC